MTHPAKCSFSPVYSQNGRRGALESLDQDCPEELDMVRTYVAEGISAERGSQGQRKRAWGLDEK